LDLVEIFFKEHSILCRTIRTTRNYWKYIIEVKHPESFKKIGFEKSAEIAREVLRDPDVVIREKIDPNVYIYYRRYKRYFICIVSKHLKEDGYIITAYITDHLKKGERVYEKNKDLL